jgi:hypothetical protein
MGPIGENAHTLDGPGDIIMFKLFVQKIYKNACISEFSMAVEYCYFQSMIVL